jgi:hypothetical protein
MVGDQVFVTWGLDRIRGVVESVYETGSGRRVVVRVALPGGHDNETLALPVDAVELAEPNSEPASPGSWLPHLRYERLVRAALERLLDNARIEWHGRADDGTDLVIHTQPRPLLVQIKARPSSHKISTRELEALLAHMRNESARGLLVTDRELTAAARKLVDTTEPLRVVHWRDSRDNRVLADALESLTASAS